jgi:oligopeptide/dipeptide ABC transporter ATP-binding protein
MADPVMRVDDLNVWFEVPGGEVHPVRDVSFELQRGERLGLVGESGCGKTTVMLALMGLLPPNASVSGRVLIEGVDLLERGEVSVREHRWRDVAMVFQGAMNAFNPVRRIGAQLVEPMVFHGVEKGAAAKSRACELLELVGLPATRFESFPHELSGGQRQRAAIAMALACRPKVLLADEPTTALDVIVQAQVLDLLQQLSDDLGLSLLIVTHDLPIVASLCHRSVVMYAGQVAESGAALDLVRNPFHPYTRLLHAATPEIAGSGPIASIPGVPPRLDHPFPGCAFVDRCDVADDACASQQPQLLEIAQGRAVRCLHPEVRQ